MRSLVVTPFPPARGLREKASGVQYRLRTFVQSIAEICDDTEILHFVDAELLTVTVSRQLPGTNSEQSLHPRSSLQLSPSADAVPANPNTTLLTIDAARSFFIDDPSLRFRKT
jgi:hypothetical protein